MISDKKISYIFNIIAIIIVVGAYIIYSIFNQTSSNIKNENLKSNIKYIDNITLNISSLIKSSIPNNIYDSLKENTKLRVSLEKNLQFLITNKYRYVYIVDKEKDDNTEFRFLLDGSKSIKDKSDFAEEYLPLNLSVWNKVYKTKEALYFEHKDLESVWLTYLKPIIINNKVSAIIVIDFSLQDHDTIVSSLSSLDNSFLLTLIFAILIFIIINIFSYIDRQRIMELKKQSKEISKFNITLQDKVKNEVEKNRQKDQHIIQQSRLAQMGEMISMIAHQWRQPLAAISSTSTAINLKAKLHKLDEATIIDSSDKIIKYSQHLSTTIDDFREFFKSNKEKKDTTYSELIKSVLNIVQIAIENKNIKIITNLNCKNTFNTYPNEVKQVILNLIKNAEDVLVEKNIKNPMIRIETVNSILTISDNGEGISKDIMDKIFDPYFSTKIKKDGTGLGLYMSKTIIEDHCNGKLSVENKEIINQDGTSSNGAVFSINLEKVNNG